MEIISQIIAVSQQHSWWSSFTELLPGLLSNWLTLWGASHRLAAHALCCRVTRSIETERCARVVCLWRGCLADPGKSWQTWSPVSRGGSTPTQSATVHLFFISHTSHTHTHFISFLLLWTGRENRSLAQNSTSLRNMAALTLVLSLPFQWCFNFLFFVSFVFVCVVVFLTYIWVWGKLCQPGIWAPGKGTQS